MRLPRMGLLCDRRWVMLDGATVDNIVRPAAIAFIAQMLSPDATFGLFLRNSARS